MGNCRAEVQKFPLSGKVRASLAPQRSQLSHSVKHPALSPCLATPITVLMLFCRDEGRIFLFFFVQIVLHILHIWGTILREVKFTELLSGSYTSCSKIHGVKYCWCSTEVKSGHSSKGQLQRGMKFEENK